MKTEYVHTRDIRTRTLFTKIPVEQLTMLRNVTKILLDYQNQSQYIRPASVIRATEFLLLLRLHLASTRAFGTVNPHFGFVERRNYQAAGS